MENCGRSVNKGKKKNEEVVAQQEMQMEWSQQ